MAGGFVRLAGVFLAFDSPALPALRLYLRVSVTLAMQGRSEGCILIVVPRMEYIRSSNSIPQERGVVVDKGGQVDHQVHHITCETMSVQPRADPIRDVGSDELRAQTNESTAGLGHAGVGCRLLLEGPGRPWREISRTYRFLQDSGTKMPALFRKVTGRQQTWLAWMALPFSGVRMQAGRKLQRLFDGWETLILTQDKKGCNLEAQFAARLPDVDGSIDELDLSPHLVRTWTSRQPGSSRALIAWQGKVTTKYSDCIGNCKIQTDSGDGCISVRYGKIQCYSRSTAPLELQAGLAHLSKFAP
ncbi:hypothetical protein CSIM01_12676 [Colletotrichum simmondsii]|uniref:Uncharacterized protein n=1 Tax=Colletotrichum simmondsii TaxID=703756 RepID=A0A135T9Q6_9PEZI|nr:hypothetical protein CSIM01_12676 [Colletotrichum simmondsii]